MQATSNLCPRCSCGSITRSGFVNGKQRYKCASCNYHFTLGARGVSPEVKRMALHLYMEGMGFRAISRIIGVSDVAIAKWIKPVRMHIQPFRKQSAAMQELHRIETFLVTKEAFDRFGWLFIGMEENAGLCLLGSYTLGSYKLY